MSYRVLAFVTACVLAFLYVPIATLMIFSFNDNKVMRLPFGDWTLEWYVKAFTNPQLLAAVGNSLIVAVCALAICLAIGIPTALALSRYDFPGKTVFRRLAILPITLPGIITGVSMLSFFSQLGVELSLTTVIVGHGTAFAAIVITSVYARLERFDRRIIEASADLGATPLRTFWKVTLPNIRTSIIGSSLLVFTLSFDEIPGDLLPHRARQHAAHVHLVRHPPRHHARDQRHRHGDHRRLDHPDRGLRRDPHPAGGEAAGAVTPWRNTAVLSRRRSWSTRAPEHWVSPTKSKLPMEKGNQDYESALRAEGIEMWFGNVGALTGVDLSVGRNEIVGLVGDNGAGKSTLIKIITGVLRPTAGSLYIRDEEVDLRGYSVLRAHQLGIETVHQERSLCEKQPLWRNFFVGRQITNRFGFINVRKQKELAQEILLKSIGFRGAGITVDTTVEDLSGGERQGIAIGRAMHFNADLILLDEPTAALGVKEVSKVLEFVQDIKTSGRACLYIEHNLAHVHAVADRIVIIDRGTIVHEILRGEMSVAELTSFLIELQTEREHAED